MSVQQTFTSLVPLISSIPILVLGILALLRRKKSSINVMFFFFSFFTSVWLLSSYFLFNSCSNEVQVIFWEKIIYSSVIFLPVIGFQITSKFGNFKQNRIIFILYCFAFLFLALNWNGLLTDGVFYYKWGCHAVAKPLHTIFLIYFVLGTLALFLNLLKFYRNTENSISRLQAKFMFLALVVLALLGSTAFAPAYMYSFYPFGYLAGIFSAVILGYAVFKHQLFNVKIIFAELLIFGLWIFLIIRIVLSYNIQERIINSFLFTATVIIGIYLVRSIFTEIHNREKIEKLAEELAGANARLRELDKQKSEFVSIASHQLRSPLTAMKGYSSMILEETFGKVPEKLLEPIKRIYESSERLVLIIEDFLNISRIEQGRMKYDFSTVDLEKIVNEVLEDLESSFKRKKLWFKLELIDKGPFNITADSGKVHQVVSNLIDNSIKYTPKGGVTISLRKDETSRKVLLTISDTGIGIPPEIIPRLFQKFSRADDAGRENIQGTGLGLYVAKEIMKAHRGNIWVDSEGKGKGSTFHLEFMAE